VRHYTRSLAACEREYVPNECSRGVAARFLGTLRAPLAQWNFIEVRNRGKRMRTKQTTLWSLIGSLLLSAMFIAGCNTVEGVGRDIEELGDEIEDEADDARR
jgi:predicted small secreted protein